MEVGRFNQISGWFWIAITIMIGCYSAMNIEKWMQASIQNPGSAKQIRLTVTMFRYAHAMGIVAAIINIVYGIQIDKTRLHKSIKITGSSLAIAGMVGITLVWFGILAGSPLVTLLMIPPLLIVAVLILGYGELYT